MKKSSPRKSQSPEVLPKLSVGRPTDFRPEYCELLISHMKDGGSMEAFASKLNCAISTLYNWLDHHEEFMEARKVGFGHLNQFYENLGKAAITGQLRRLKSETPMLDADGKPILDPNTGQVLIRREYEPITPPQSIFIFMTKNLLGWKDSREITWKPSDSARDYSAMSTEELKAELKKLQEEAGKYLNEHSK